MTDDIPDRVSRTYPDLEGKKVCKTCDWCVKPNMWDHRHWLCKAPQNILSNESGPVIDPISGDWMYYLDGCDEARSRCEGNWYQVDPYIPINGIRHIDKVRETARTTERVTISELRKMTMKDLL